jgi:AAA15 family ATPase/GTPase
MGFQSIEINHFRGIRRLEIGNMKRINILTGANNVGKTSILEACLMLVGISNPYLGFKINYFRSFRSFQNKMFSNRKVGSFFRNYPSEYLKDLEVLFYQLDCQMPIHLKAIQISGNTRETFIKPVYDYNLSNADKPSEGLSSENEKRIIGLSSEFNINGIPYISTTQNVKGENSQPDFIPSKKYKENLYAKLFKTEISSTGIIPSFKKFITEKRIDSVISILKKIEPSLVDIIVVDNEIMVDTGLPKYISLDVLGDGFRKILTLLTLIEECKNGILLVDEMDNGLHYSVWETVWSALFEMTRQFNTQLLITTHNSELITTLEHFLSDDAHASFRSDIMCYSIDRYANGEMAAYNYDYPGIQTAVEYKVEIR